MKPPAASYGVSGFRINLTNVTAIGREFVLGRTSLAYKTIYNKRTKKQTVTKQE